LPAEHLHQRVGEFHRIGMNDGDLADVALTEPIEFGDLREDQIALVRWSPDQNRIRGAVGHDADLAGRAGLPRRRQPSAAARPSAGREDRL